MEKYEIRHANFLEFLMDPERNVELAHEVVFQFLAQIVEDQGIDDAAFNQILDTEGFDIFKIPGSHSYTEIPAGKEGNLRIDHAFELKVGRMRRVIVFEYKYNGSIYNDLEAYKETIDDLYNGTIAKPYFFIMDLGKKIHFTSPHSDFSVLSKDLLIESLQQTLVEARRKDMMNTRLYLEQYLDILAPAPKEQSILEGLEKQLWQLWNPKIENIDIEAKYFNILVEKNIDDEGHRDELYGYHYSQVFDRKVEAALDQYSASLYPKLNQGWVRAIPNKCEFKDLYLWAALWHVDNKVYQVINLRSYHDLKKDDSMVAKQTGFMLDVISKSKYSKSLDAIGNISDCKKILVTDGIESPSIDARRANGKRVHDIVVRFAQEITFETLENILTTDKSVDEFDTLIKNVVEFADLINSNS